MSTQLVPPGAQEPFDVDDPSLARFDLVREGARRDGVEIVHYQPRFPVPGTRAERRVERSIALLLVLSGLAAFGFVAAYIWWPFHYEPGPNAAKWYTPLLGLTLGLALALLGFGMVTWAKKLFPEEVSVQERHDGPSPHDEAQLTGATMVNMVDELGIRRRPLMKAALLLPAGGLGIAAVAPLIGGLIKDPHNPEILAHTVWAKGIRLVREDYTPIRPEDISVGGQITAYPGVPGGTGNHHADAPTLLIHLRDADAQIARDNANNPDNERRLNVGSQWGNFVAYSKICTHAGCPASLYEQQTNRLLCPCHQSQFDIIDNARPIFGPATRALPQLPLDVDEEGFFIAQSDYRVPVGPAYWERP
jgi:ubiquinol-cytochrome c reductase iron-sulfur subunit